jgi:hypothetical protein
MRFEVRLEKDEEDDDNRLALSVIIDGQTALQEFDRGEPEDQTFYRDWAWVPDAIRDAYALGRKHALEEVR